MRQYGNVDEQVELVAQQLKDVPQLSGGFDAIGFSQGSYCYQCRIRMRVPRATRF